MLHFFRRNSVAFMTVALALATLGTPAGAQHTGKETIETLTKMFVDWSGKVSDSSVYDKAARFIDYDGIAERSLSKPQWDKLKPEERTALSSTLRTLIQQRYYPRWHKIFGKGKLDYTGESESKGDVLVKTNLTVGKKQDNLVWRLDSRGGEHKVVSLAVGDNDLLNKLSSRLQSRYAKTGYKGLMGWLNKKADFDDDSEVKRASSSPSAPI